MITRAEFAPFANETANADFRSLLIGRNVGSVPPKGMLMPLRLEVELVPVPETDGAVDPAVPAPDAPAL